jgi:hypothetical protein
VTFKRARSSNKIAKSAATTSGNHPSRLTSLPRRAEFDKARAQLLIAAHADMHPVSCSPLLLQRSIASAYHMPSATRLHVPAFAVCLAGRHYSSPRPPPWPVRRKRSAFELVRCLQFCLRSRVHSFLVRSQTHSPSTLRDRCQTCFAGVAGPQQI